MNEARVPHCQDFEEGRCHSCSLWGQPYALQLRDKQRQAETALSGWPDLRWLDPVASAVTGFRNKAKMAVGGDVEAPTLGILDAEFRGVDLGRCPLYPPTIRAAFEPLREFIRLARIPPYDVGRRRGELKQVLLTVSAAPGEPLMLRLVLRSREAQSRIEKHLPWLRERLPALSVVSINLLPEHAARIEGDSEFLLAGPDTLAMPVNGIPLYLRPGGFFQTNTGVAAALYRQAREWMAAAKPQRVLDLFCGVGGFALHAATLESPPLQIHGIEISPEAIACARRSARELADAGCPAELRFEALDTGSLPDLGDTGQTTLVVNPPRRGIGRELAAQIDASAAPLLIYSSCNVDSLARDLRAMPSWQPCEARVLDMFPHSHHYETIVRLERVAAT